MAMVNNPEYTSPWADQLPSSPEEALRARNAFVRLQKYFYFSSSGTITPEKQLEVTKKLHRTVETYFALSVRIAAEGITGEDRDRFIKDGLKSEALIDQSDTDRADEEYTIISEGYELNKPYWDEKLGRMRRFRNDLQDMPNELGNP